MKQKKTNAVRLLEQQGVGYALMEYTVDEADLSAPSVAAKVGLPPKQVFKTLVARGDKTGVLLACIAAAAELNLKALAQASANKRVELVPLKEVQALTGYIRGGVSPVGTKKSYPVYVDASVLAQPLVAVSAGVRGCQMLLKPEDLVRATAAVVCPIAAGQGPREDDHEPSY